MRVKIKTTSFLLLFMLKNAFSAEILGIFPNPGYSQFILGETLMGELANRGHKVVVISEYTPKNNYSGYETILLEKSEPYDTSLDLLEYNKQTTFSIYKDLSDLCIKITEGFFNQKVVRNLIKSNRKFDMIIVENFCTEGYTAFADRFNASLVVFSSQPLHDWSFHLIGNPRLPAICPNFATDFLQEMSFKERLENFVLTVFDYLYRELVFYPHQQKLVDESFGYKMDIREVFTRSELVLLFSHPLTTGPSLKVNNVVEVGGFHIKAKKLPSDVEKVLDEAENGAIFFSLGSNVPCDILSKEMLDIFLRVFKKLPQRIIWKCTLKVDKPDNVFMFKWLPQTDILAHKNTVAFITHNGLLSTTESIYYAVPMISIPVFADQGLNARRMKAFGIAEKVDLENLTEEELYETIRKVVINPKYKERITMISKMFKDQPIKPLDKAIHSIEHVLKYKSRELLRSPALNLSWFQLYSIDVVLFIYLSFYLSYKILKFFMCKLLNKTVKESGNKKKKD